MRMRTPIGARSQQLPLWPQCYPIQALRPAPAAQALVIAKTGRRTQVRPPLAQRRELALEAPRVANSMSTMRGASDSQSDVRSSHRPSALLGEVKAAFDTNSDF